MIALIQDVRYGVRTLLRKPGFTTAAILALALGIGANTAIFSFVHGVLLKRLPYANPDRIQMIYSTNVQQNRDKEPFSTGDYLDVRNQSRSFESVAAYQRGNSFTLPTASGTEYLAGSAVTADFFGVLGAKAEMGRTFQEGEDTAQSGPMVVISDRMWRKNLDSDPNVIGRTLAFTNGPQTVIGVMPPDFQFPSNSVDVWRNLRIGPLRGRGPYLWGIGRLKAGVTRRQADLELQSLGKLVEQANPLTNTGTGFRLMPVEEFLFGNVRTVLYILLGAVAFVLLIAAANVANLLLAQSVTREKEVAIRSALGAGRGRIVRQLLTESVALSAMGGLVGLALAEWGLDAFIALAPANIPRLDKVSIDVSVLGFTAAASILSGLFLGLAPALQTRRVDLNSRLKDAGRGNTVGGSHRLRSVLIVSEIALSLVLLAGAGVTIRSFNRLLKVDTGFDGANVLAIRPGLNFDSSEKRVAFQEELERRVATLPGVKAVGMTNSLPPIQNDLNDSFTIEGRPASESANPPVATVLMVSPGYFKTLNIPVLRGRSFTASDRSTTPKVALINETMARRYFSGQDPIGQRLRVGGPERDGLPWWEIVGVVKDVRYDGLTSVVDPAYYFPYAQIDSGGMDLVIKTVGNPALLVPAVRAEIRSMDPNIPLARVTTLDERMALAVGQPRFQTLLLGGFSVIALLLASVGVYGVLSYSISLRTHEIGVRMSLGASRRDVLLMVIGEGMMLAIAGSAAGLAGALALTGLLKGALFEISPRDPATFAVVSLLMLGVAFLACCIPALRATRVDPMVALRHE